MVRRTIAHDDGDVKSMIGCAREAMTVDSKGVSQSVMRGSWTDVSALSGSRLTSS